jgi:prepilin-type N-terminal cleavage/methylation domain-containing protein
MLSLNKKFGSRKGFTLIEMLIVIAIIGILASIVLVGLGPVQKKGRDSRRISDLKEIQTALELYFNKNGSYPSDSSWATLQTDLKGAGIGTANIPNDPRVGQNYGYAVNSAKTSYVLGAQLEDPSNSAIRDSFTGNTFASSAETFTLSDSLGTCGAAGVYCISL